MSRYVAYDAVNTKIKSMMSKLLIEENWNRVIECKNVEELVSVLKDSPEFERILRGVEPQQIHRDDLETAFGRLQVAEMESIIHYFSGPYKAFLQMLLFEFELIDLILVIRKVSQNENLDDVRKHFMHSEKFSELAFDKLIASSNIADLTANLAANAKSSSFYEKLRNLSSDDVIKREFHIEMELQIYLYNNLLKRAKNLSNADRVEVEDILGFKIDFENVQWIYRGMKYYNISPEEILIYCMPGGKRISYQGLKKLCYTKSTEEMKSLANKYLKKYDVFDVSEDSQIGINMDRYFLKYLSKIDRNKKSIGTVLAYYYMNGIIFKDFIIITEGIKYKVPIEILEKYLTRIA
jgi:V/A-type H+-transporting ATPase subunit C